RFQPGAVITTNIVDCLLAILHGAGVVGEAPPLVTRSAAEARELQQLLLALPILVNAFLEDDAEILPDLGERVAVVFSKLLQVAQDPVRDAFPDGREKGAFLYHLA